MNHSPPPLPPKGAVVTETVCQYCSVGCAYTAYRWPEGQDGGPAPSENALGVDLREPQSALHGLPYTAPMDPRQIVPMGALPILVSSVFAYGIAEGWQRGAGVALPYMCAGSLAVHLLSLWALASCEGRLAAVVRIAALAATLSVSLLSLWATGSTAWVFRW